MPLLNRHGVHIYYEVHGSGRPLILSNGFSANCAMWHGQVEALAKEFKLILWDMRGHGQSDYPSDPAAYSEDLTVEDMGAIITQVAGGSTKALVGGLSLGGYMSLAFYNKYPERVAGLLLFDTTPGASDATRDDWNRRVSLVADQLDATGVSLLEMAAEGPERKRALRHRNVKGLALAARGMLASHKPGFLPLLPKVGVPTLVLVGEDDEQFVPHCEVMGRTIPGAQYVVVPDAGHAVNLDQPELFRNAVMAFLQQFSAVRANL